MPVYVCKAITPQGQLVKSRITDSSKLACVKKLKRNGLTPVSVTQTLTVIRKNNQLKRKRNTKLQYEPDYKLSASTAKIKSKTQNEGTFIEKLDKTLQSTEKITFKDIKVFSQNFYLLKKAKFNNIHALSTVIDTTENPRFKAILEDILIGIEGRRIYVFNYGIL